MTLAPSRGPLVLAAPADPSPLRIFGGRGGTVARLEDLDRSAQALDGAARALDAAFAALTRVQAKLDEWSAAPLDPTPEQIASITTARAARGAVEPLRHGPWGTRALAGELRDAAAKVRSARQGYESAEGLASRAFRGVLSYLVTGFTATPLGTIVLSKPLVLSLATEAAVWKLGGGPYPGDRTEKYLFVLANMIRSIGSGPRLASGDPVPEAAGRLARTIRLAQPPRKIEALEVPGGGSTGEPPRGVRDLVRPFKDAGTLNPDGSFRGDGVIVTKISRPDGSTAWSVTIPGTQRAGAGWEDHPFDNLSNLELEAGMLSDSEKAVRLAMEKAGVGAEDPVVLTGHSQGGLIAQRIAATGGFSVAAVLTIGSPTGTSTMRSTVPTLHVEHVGEPVSSLDANPNRDDKLSTTVVRELDEESSRDPRVIHDTATYEETAAAIDASEDPSVRSWLDELEGALGSDGEAESRVFSVHRLATL